MWTSPLIYLAGVLTAPIVGAVAKPLVRGTVKGGILVARQVRRMAQEVRADFEDIAAEATSDLDARRPHPSTTVPVERGDG